MAISPTIIAKNANGIPINKKFPEIMQQETPSAIKFAKTAGARPNERFFSKPTAENQRPIDPTRAKIISADNAAGALTSEIKGAINR